eukprot:UN05299
MIIVIFLVIGIVLLLTLVVIICVICYYNLKLRYLMHNSFLEMEEIENNIHSKDDEYTDNEQILHITSFHENNSDPIICINKSIDEKNATIKRSEAMPNNFQQKILRKSKQILVIMKFYWNV